MVKACQPYQERVWLSKTPNSLRQPMFYHNSLSTKHANGLNVHTDSTCKSQQTGCRSGRNASLPALRALAAFLFSRSSRWTFLNMLCLNLLMGASTSLAWHACKTRHTPGSPRKQESSCLAKHALRLAHQDRTLRINCCQLLPVTMLATANAVLSGCHCDASSSSILARKCPQSVCISTGTPKNANISTPQI